MAQLGECPICDLSYPVEGVFTPVLSLSSAVQGLDFRTEGCCTPENLGQGHLAMN